MDKNYPVPPAYRVLTPGALLDLIAGLDGMPARLGPDPATWRAVEISDGNMNAVFRVSGPAGSLIAKQALPYIRAIGEAWPFPVSRATFEVRALEVHGACAPGRVPEVFGFHADLALIVMEDFAGHAVLRHALLEGRSFPRLAGDLGDYLARSLVLTSDLVLATGEKNALADRFSGNSVLCETTQDVVFTGPYWEAPLNRLTPGQEALAAAFRGDAALKRAAAEMKYIFRSRAEALVHGDLHTGSVMVGDRDTRVIDPEWAFMGPMGFDIGAVLGNLLLAHASQPGHASAPGARDGHAAWLLTLVPDIWAAFEAGVRALARPRDGGVLIPQVADAGLEDAFLTTRLRSIFKDALGFAGAKMIRRILGISHVEDFERIADVSRRAACEARALHLARRLLLERHAIGSAAEVANLARAISAEPHPRRKAP